MGPDLTQLAGRRWAQGEEDVTMGRRPRGLRLPAPELGGSARYVHFDTTPWGACIGEDTFSVVSAECVAENGV